MLQAAEQIARQVKYPQGISIVLQPGCQPRTAFDGKISAVLQELVFTGSNDDQIRLILEHLLYDRRQTVTGVGDTATINRLEGPPGNTGGKLQLEPFGEGGFALIWMTINGRAAETEDAKAGWRLLDRELLR